MSYGSIALGVIVEYPKNGDARWGTYSSLTQDPQSLSRTDQAGIGGRTLAQFCINLLNEGIRTLETGPQTMQHWPYKRFAYAISVIPDGHGGGRSLSGTVPNEACQTCRDDLLVRNSLRTFAVQEMRIRSLGWTRENIWGPYRVNENGLQERDPPTS